MKVSVLLLGLLVCFLAFPRSSNAEEPCPSNTVGLCTPGVTEVIESDTVTSEETSATGTTTTETTTTTTTTTTVTNEDIGNLLTDNKVSEMGRNQRFGGDMSSDWGGQGPASMPTGSTCGQLGTDRCAQITGSGNSTSTQGVSGMGTTFIQTIDVSNQGIGSKGGRTNYTIKVEKRDASDRIYMHITGKDGTTVSFAGTDILSEAGVASGFQAYSGGFDFGGTLTSIIVEVGGRDINLSIGPLFDDVTINVLYNVISTIVQEQITTIETFVSLGIFDQETIDVATNVFENNDVSIGPSGETDIQPNIDENIENMPSYEAVQMEIEMEMPDMELSSSLDMEMPTPDTSVPEVEVEMDVNMEMEMEMESPTSEPMETTDVGPEESMDMESPTSEVQEEASSSTADETNEPTEEIEPESSSADSSSEDNEQESSEVVENKSEPKKETKEELKKVTKTKQEKKQTAKQKAAKKILKKMGDRGKYDNVNQIKTLIIMQVLGNTKDFFSAQKLIPQPEGFFTQTRIPDATISDNNYNQYFMFGGSDAVHDALVDSQYRRQE